MANVSRLPRSTEKILSNLYKNRKFKRIPKGEKPVLGSIVLFKYEAKHRDILPHFDRLPFSIPIVYYDNGFAGLNIHYLPYTHRLSFAKDVMKAKRITYPVIKNAYQKLQLPKGYGALIFRRYLYTHLRSSLVEFTYKDYYEAAKNINGRWAKQSEAEVFRLINQKWSTHVKTTQYNKRTKTIWTTKTKRA